MTRNAANKLSDAQLSIVVAKQREWIRIDVASLDAAWPLWCELYENTGLTGNALLVLSDNRHDPRAAARALCIEWLCWKGVVT